MTPPPDVVLLDRRIDPAELARLVKAHFEDMVKYVVDVERGVIALGGELHVDGERFANAVAALEVPPKELTWRTGVDVLTLGGAKSGLPLGEAVVFFDKQLAFEFDYRCKQAGQLASKMRFLSAPWLGLLKNDALLRNAAHANACAKTLAGELTAIPGVTLVHPVEANAVFVQLPEAVIAALRKRGWVFYTFIGSGHCRFMCSWATSASCSAASRPWAGQCAPAMSASASSGSQISPARSFNWSGIAGVAAWISSW